MAHGRRLKNRKMADKRRWNQYHVKLSNVAEKNRKTNTQTHT